MKRTITIIATVEDDTDKDPETSAREMQNELNGQPFVLVHVFPGIFIPGTHICDQHKALTNEHAG